MFESVLVANRGEIAVRVIQACRELDVEAVAVYSDADEGAKHVRHADEAYHVGGSVARKSYLDADAILDAADRGDVDAVHPGYGFLAENAAFASTVERSAFAWIGPPSGVIDDLGEKTRARSIARRSGVPLVPGTSGPVTDVDTVRAFAEEHGYPIAIKADGGGGGRGLVVVADESGIEGGLERARREGEAYFDNPAVYVEKYLEAPRHVEVQILADDHGNVRHLGERDCTVQRNQQKLVEETPSPVLDTDTRDRLCEAARRTMAEADYRNAGTVEFLYQDGSFHFLEVNPRIQVEHPVTEAVTGVDIVKWQIRIAAGAEFDLDQSAVEPRGVAMEFRINAEDPDTGFTPEPGTLRTYRPPRGIGVRVDDGVDEGDEIGPFYDSMFAKFVVTAADRGELLRRSRRALREAEIEGVPTTIGFHERVISSESFRENRHTTRFVEEAMADPGDATRGSGLG